MKKYKILIEYYNKTQENEVIELQTDRLQWSMDQYQRNRDPFQWKLVK